MECLSVEVLDHSVETARNGTDPGPAKIHVLSLIVDRHTFIEVVMFS